MAALAVPCIHCRVPPERRLQEETGRIMWICPLCSNRGEAVACERRALASWQLVNDEDMPRHTCKGEGVPRFFVSRERWGSRCPCCDFVDHGYATLEGARAGWARAVR
ncbi:hypothetical protein [Pseudomonas aeruginosa]|uniref:hypothetical protein n=1 Tax=Pseudomonas aeruginosa TaxID=287 RepID=UPI00053EA272|nr:hypothetical protein [Pseudomonas aeruginosa]